MKLSIKKYEAILGIVEFFNKNDINWYNLPEKEIRKILKNLKGVGKWSIDMILMYTLNKPNIFPVDDYHLKNIMVSLYELDDKSSLNKQLNEIANKWSPYKSLATQYLLSYKKYLKEK